MSESEKRTLLVEIGTEELPPGLVFELAGSLYEKLCKKFMNTNVEFSDTNSKSFCTSRRIAVKIKDVATHQLGDKAKRKGPPATQINRDDPATQGFAKSCGVEVGDLEIRDGRLFCEAETGGKPLTEILPPLLPDLLNQIQIPRRMRWGGGRHAFARPVHWLCVLHGEKVINCELFGVKAGHTTYGHRHHCGQPLKLKCADAYEETLEEQGHVIAFLGKRKENIERQIRQEAKTRKGYAESSRHASSYENLLNETTATTEWPQALAADFDKTFLALPPEVITQTLEHALKVFSLRDEKDRLLPHFIIVADIESTDPGTIVRGYENVVRARLEDARFFFEQDKKISLEARREVLQRTQFQKDLGTLADKAARLEKLAVFLAPHCDASPEHAQRAAQLCKCDLGSELVGEYPELQGIMGGYYATADGEHEAVAAAIKDHYLPQRQWGEKPTTPEGRVLALADKADTLTGFFGIGLKPTSSKDPYGLRRAVADIIRILIEREINLDTETLIEKTVTAYSDLFKDPETVRKDVCAYINEQLHNVMQTWGFDAGLAKYPDRVEAVAGAEPKTMQPLDFSRRIEALDSFIKNPAADSLIAANKRIRNILAKSDGATTEPDAGAMTEAAERDLLKAVNDRRKTFDQQFEAHKYVAAMETLAELRAPVDRFFDEVLVMSEDEKERTNRLALLSSIRAMFLKIADFSELNPAKAEAKE